MAAKKAQTKTFIATSSAFILRPALSKIVRLPENQGRLDRGKPSSLQTRSLSSAWGGRFGAVAQLGERLVRNEEVSGSIPLSSTIPPGWVFRTGNFPFSYP